MNLSEYAQKNFNGDEDRALKYMAEEPDEEFWLSPEWFSIVDSFTEEQQAAFDQYSEEYLQNNKTPLTKQMVLSKRRDYIAKRNVLSAIGLFTTILFLFLYIPMFFVMLFLDILLFVWVLRNNKVHKALGSNDFYIRKAACTYKHHEKKEDSEGSEFHYYRIYFRGFDAYNGTASDYENIQCDEECFLIIVNGTTKIQQIYQTKYYEISDDFRLEEDRYLPIV